MKTYLLVLFLFFTFLANAAKTDLIILRNGDRITGEIKSMEKGKLRYSTDDAGTLSIKWVKIEKIYSSQLFEFVLSNGNKYYGSISWGDANGTFKLINELGGMVISLRDVVIIMPIEKSFWNKVNGQASIGYNYTKATTLSQLTGNLSASYRSSKNKHTINVSSIFSRQNDADDALRQEANYMYDKLLQKKWFYRAGVGWQQNTELGIQSRTNLNYIAGKNLVLTNNTHFQLGAGLQANNESNLEGASAQSLEGILTIRYDHFKYDSPKVNIVSFYNLFPSLNIQGRVRHELEARVSWEIISDIVFEIRYYLNADNLPVTESAADIDWGVISSLGYKF